MKTFLQNSLIVGGIYFIISSVIPSSKNNIIQLIDGAVFLVFIITLTVLIFKKSFNFIEKLQNKMPKICNYLKALGVVQIFAVCFISIPGIIYGYNATMAQHQGEEYLSIIPQYLSYTAYAYVVLLGATLLWATYQSFIKLHQNG